MKKYLIFSLVIFCLLSCYRQKHPFVMGAADAWAIPAPSRALIANTGGVHFAGAKGVYATFQRDSLTWQLDTTSLSDDFETRSIATTSEGVFILNAGSPAYLLKSTDSYVNWISTYTESDSLAFYDAMRFWNDTLGIAIGDPTEDCMSVLLTNDGGKSWHKVKCENLPAVIPGEAAFAASNSNIDIVGNRVWFVTGGKAARMFRSDDMGNSWQSFITPMVQGAAMTGIFAVNFYDENFGIIAGGDWEHPENNSNNLAVTYDGGETWKLISDGQGPGYISSVEFIPGLGPDAFVVTSNEQTMYTLDLGATWHDLNQQGYYTVRFLESENEMWFCGRDSIKRTKFLINQ